MTNLKPFTKIRTNIDVTLYQTDTLQILEIPINTYGHVANIPHPSPDMVWVAFENGVLYPGYFEYDIVDLDVLNHVIGTERPSEGP
jgi:hypothetical protein